MLDDDMQPIEVEMLVPSQHFMNNFELLNQPKNHDFQTYVQPSESEYFDCNPGKKDLVEDSLFIPSKQKKADTFDANENAQYPIDRTLMKQV